MWQLHAALVLDWKLSRKKYVWFFPTPKELIAVIQVGELVEVCRNNDFTDIVVVQEHRGEPDGLIVSHLPFGPTCYFSLANTVMRHDIEGCGTVSEAYPHLIFDNFKSKIGERIMNILKYLFPVPKDDSKRVMTFRNENDFISFRHHNYNKADGIRTLSSKRWSPLWTAATWSSLGYTGPI